MANGISRAIAEALSTQIGRHVVADNVDHLVEKKLRPSGLIAGAGDHDETKALSRSLPLLALRYRKRVIPARLHRGITTALRPTFWPPVVLLVVGGLIAVNIWLLGTQRTALSRAVRQLPFHPNLFLLVTVLVIFSGFFHELGHATATKYGGGSPGVMGVGIYLAWPAFYTDLTDSYRLNRAGRLRSDLGGVYFNAVLIVAAGAAYLATGFGPLAVFIVVSQAMAMYQFLPFVRLDGYYIMSDLVGVPNLFAYLGPVLRSTFRRSDPATTSQLSLLKPRARRAIKVWSLVTVVFLAFNFVGLALLAPIILPAELQSIRLQAQAMVEAFARGSIAVGVNDLVDLVVVAIAPVGLLLIAGILLRRAFQVLKKWWPSHPKVTAALAAVLAGLLLFQGQGLVSRFAALPAPPGSAVTAVKGGPTPHQVIGHTPRSAIVRAAPRSSNTPGIWSASLPPVHLAAAPSTQYRFYVVQVGDTLWGIAAHNLGDPERWPAIYDLNVGRPQPDGRSLADPDLIYPGWRLQLPGPQPVTGLTPQPGTRVALTDDAVVAPSSRAPAMQTGLDTSSAGPAPPPNLPPAASHPVYPPQPEASGQAPSAGGPNPEGGSTRAMTSGAAGTGVQRQRQAATTTDRPPVTTRRCEASPPECRSAREDVGQLETTPPEPTSPAVSLPNPDSPPRGNLTEPQHAEETLGHRGVTNEQAPGVSERGPPSPRPLGVP